MRTGALRRQQGTQRPGCGSRRENDKGRRLLPYSPDDERPGSKTIVLVEYGTVQEVKDAILQTPFLLEKFKKVKEKYKLNIDFLEDK